MIEASKTTANNTLAALKVVCAALASGAVTLTELEGDGAILMLAKRDEMLTINASAAWLVARLLEPTLICSDAENVADQLIQQFAQHFGITLSQAEVDAQQFLTHLAKQLV